MATLSFSLSKKADKVTGKHEILSRFVVGSRINQRAKTNIFAPAEYWNAANQAVTVPRWRLMNEQQARLAESLNEINTRLQGLRSAVMESFIQAGAGKQPLPPDWLTSTIDRHNFPEKYEIKPETLYLTDGFADYLQNNKISSQREKNTRVVLRSLLRYEAYTGTRMELDTITADDLRDLENYIRQEGEIVAKHPELLQICPESRAIEARSENTINCRMKILRAVVLWAVTNGHTTNNPFSRYSVGECVYGTPYYISVDERNALYKFDLSARPTLAVQRDIFVFQCLIGCRVSDLLSLTRSNLIAGGIEYIPRKTKDERPTTVRVPLNTIAAEIVARYEDEHRAALLPFVSAQKYNDAIKEAFTMAGLTRPVTVLDPMTRQEVQRPLNEIASSHLARRTFVGNLYKQVRDPNLIAKLSGHIEGSRAFARYRDIDEDIRKDLVKLLEG
jgi:integrase